METKRCAVCDVASGGYSDYNPRLQVIEHESERRSFLRSLSFTKDSEGNTICNSCDEMINETLAEMEFEDEQE